MSDADLTLRRLRCREFEDAVPWEDIIASMEEDADE